MQEQVEQMEKQKRRMSKKRGKAFKPGVYSQFGQESTGQANLMSQEQAVRRRDSLKNELEQNLRARVNKYLSQDARQMIADHELIIAKQAGDEGKGKNAKMQKKMTQLDKDRQEIEELN